MSQPEFGYGVGGVADLTLTRTEDQDVTLGLAEQFHYGIRNGLRLIPQFRSVGVIQRPVSRLDRVGAAGDLDDRSATEVFREPRSVDGRRRNGQFEVGPLREQIA